VSTGSEAVQTIGSSLLAVSLPESVTTTSASANLSNTGSSNAIAWLQPTVMLNAILRII
jgi:hypothetical protein